MEKKPVKSSHGNELLDPEFVSYHNSIHPLNPWLMGHTTDFIHRNHPAFPQPILGPACENFTNPNDYYPYPPAHFKAMQNQQLVPNSRVSYLAQPTPNFTTNQYMASSSRNPPLPFYQERPVWRNNDLNNGGRLFKRKNVETSVFYHGSGSPTSSSSVSQDSFPGTRSIEANVPNATQFIQPEHQYVFLPVPNGYQQNVDTISLPFQPSMAHHQNYLIQAQRNNYMSHVLPPARSNMGLDQYGRAVGDVGSSSQYYANTALSPFERSLIRGPPIEIRNQGNSSNQDPTSSRDITESSQSSHSVIFHNSHPLPVQDIHNHHHDDHDDVSVPTCNAGSDFSDSSGDSHDLEQTNEFHRHYSQQDSSGLNMLTDIASSDQDADVPPFSSDYNIDNLIDRYRNMRMDIDHMTYEELLALQEKIGYVRIGLSEQSILKQLKTKLYVHPYLSLSGKSSLYQTSESEKCTICQVVFEKYDKIGILDCGHFYHPNCIKDWLLVKNTCPICQTTAFPSELKR